MVKWAVSPRVQVWISGVSLAGWTAISPLAMATGLRSALWWITFMILFANVATCFGWWVASLVNQRAERVEADVSQAAQSAHLEESESRLRQQLDDLQGAVRAMDRLHGHQLAVILDLLATTPPPKKE